MPIVVGHSTPARRWGERILLLFGFSVPLAGFQLGGGLGSLAQLTGFLLAVLMTLDIATTGRVRFKSVHLMAGLWAMWSVVSLLWADSLEAGLSSAGRLVELLGAFWLPFYFIRDSNKARAVLAAYVVGVLVLYGIVAFIQFGLGPVQSSLATYSSRLELRLQNYNANAVAYILCLGFWSLLLLVLDHRRWFRRSLLLALAISLFIGILLTGTRTVALAIVLAIALCVGLWLIRKKEAIQQIAQTSKWPIFLAMVLGLAVLLMISVPLTKGPTYRIVDFINMVSHEGHSALTHDPSIGRRIAIWQVGLSTIRDSPLLGIGIGQFTSVIGAVIGEEMATAPHNAFLGIWAEQGLIGLILFCMTFVTIASRVLRAAGSRAERNTRTGLLVSLLIILNGTNIVGNPNMWFVLGLMLASPVCYLQPQQKGDFEVRPSRGTTWSAKS